MPISTHIRNLMFNSYPSDRWHQSKPWNLKNVPIWRPSPTAPLLSKHEKPSPYSLMSHNQFSFSRTQHILNNNHNIILTTIILTTIILPHNPQPFAYTTQPPYPHQQNNNLPPLPKQTMLSLPKTTPTNATTKRNPGSWG